MKPCSRSAGTVLSVVLGAIACSSFASAGIIIEASGPFQGYSGVEGLSVGFTTSTALQGVTISALLENGNFPFDDTAIGTAYLTTSLGTGTTIADEIAQANISLGCSVCEQVLFSGLDLAPGTYWLTFGSPTPPVSYLNIGALFPAVAEASAGTSFLGFYSVTDGSGPFPPGSPILADLTLDGGLPEFSVSAVPEPSELGLTGAGIVLLGIVALYPK